MTGDTNLPRFPGENLTPPWMSEKISECLRLENLWAGTFPFCFHVRKRKSFRSRTMETVADLKSYRVILFNRLETNRRGTTSHIAAPLSAERLITQVECWSQHILVQA